MEQLRDIKPIVTIPDSSLMYLLIIVVVIIIVLTWLIYFIWQAKCKLDKKNNRKTALEALQKLDFVNSKATAYAFKKYGEVLVNEENLSQFEAINAELERYKYKKQVDALEASLVQKIKIFVNHD